MSSKDNENKIASVKSSEHQAIRMGNQEIVVRCKSNSFIANQEETANPRQGQDSKAARENYYLCESSSSQITMYPQQQRPNQAVSYNHNNEQQLESYNGNSNRNNNWAVLESCSQTSASINNLNESRSSSHQNSSSACASNNQQQNLQYPETTFYYLTRSSYLRSMCIRMVSNKYPHHSNIHTNTHTKVAMRLSFAARN